MVQSVHLGTSTEWISARQLSSRKGVKTGRASKFTSEAQATFIIDRCVQVGRAMELRPFNPFSEIISCIISVQGLQMISCIYTQFEQLSSASIKVQRISTPTRSHALGSSAPSTQTLLTPPQSPSSGSSQAPSSDPDAGTHTSSRPPPAPSHPYPPSPHSRP